MTENSVIKISTEAGCCTSSAIDNANQVISFYKQSGYKLVMLKFCKLFFYYYFKIHFSKEQ